MAVKTGILTSYDISENKVDVSPVLNRIALPETPLLNAVGISNEAVSATRHEWWDDVRPLLTATLAADYTAGDGTITLEDATGLRVNAILRIGSSIYRATDVNTDTEIVTIAILDGDANHSDGDTVEILGQAGLEGADYTDADYTEKVSRYNVTQIWQDYVKFSGTQLSVEQYVNEDIFADEIAKKLARMRIWLEKSVINGIRVAPANNTTPRLMGGIDYFVSANGITASAGFSETNLKAFFKSIVDAGGSVSDAWMNPTMMDNFLGLTADKLVYQRADNVVGRLATQYLSQYGAVNLHIVPHMPAGQILVFNPAQVAVKPLRGRAAFYEELAKTGDNVRGQIIGEYTLEFKQSAIAGKFTIP